MDQPKLEMKQLFGGAIACMIPNGFDDVSAFRQVPDHQEVYANASTDQCIIVELLQLEQSVANDEITQHVFNDLAVANACAQGQTNILYSEELAIPSPPSIPTDNYKSILIGDQSVAKFREGENAKNVVRIYLGIIRLFSVSTDVAISISIPMQIHPESSSRTCISYENSSDIGFSMFQQVYSSFFVQDWSLFQ